MGVDLNRRLGQCSKGMRQQVALALAMAHDPELLVLDEPTAGLDPLMQVRVLDLLREQRRQGKTVFFSSHNLPEVESICDRVAMIRDGRLILVEEVQRLRERRARQVEVVFNGEARDLASELAGIPGVMDVRVHEGRASFTVSGDIRALLRRLGDAPWLRDVRIVEPSLEELFVRLYGEDDRGQPDRPPQTDPPSQSNRPS